MKPPLRALFFDAAGTLIHIPRGAAYHYADVARRHHLDLDETPLRDAFRHSWKAMPVPPTTKARRPDDDRGWWRELVDRTLDHYGISRDVDFDRDAYFSELYVEFAKPGIWGLYPDVMPMLQQLSEKVRLGMISNFDGRLRSVLRHLGIDSYFEVVVISSEVGADKPDPWIFTEAARQLAVEPGDAMHIGDEPDADWHGAAAAGFHVFRLDRSKNSLEDLLREVACSDSH